MYCHKRVDLKEPGKKLNVFQFGATGGPYKNSF